MQIVLALEVRRMLQEELCLITTTRTTQALSMNVRERWNVSYGWKLLALGTRLDFIDLPHFSHTCRRQLCLGNTLNLYGSANTGSEGLEA